MDVSVKEKRTDRFLGRIRLLRVEVYGKKQNIL